MAGGVRILAVAVAVLAAGVGPLRAQDPVDVRRAQATRVELEQAVVELEKVVNSPGYSKGYRKAREGELQMVQQRLSHGDFQPGDEIDIAVVGEASLTGTFTVLQDRTISLPQLPPISLQGVLRSEVRDYLATQIGRYLRDPQVTVQGSKIRLAIFGAVGNPGYFVIPADYLVSQAIMTAGGPSAGVEMEKSEVRRGGQVVIQGSEIQLAIEAGHSLDQLNLHGGDELVLGGGQRQGGRSGVGNPAGGVRQWLWPVQLAVSLTFLLTRIF